MNSIRGRSNGTVASAALRALAFCAAAIGTATAQNAVVSLTVPTQRVLVNGSLQLAAALTDVAGTPLDSSTLAWATSDATVASVSSSGMVQGVAPGDVTITASDANSGASDSQLLHIVPASMAIQALTVPVHVGDTVKLSAAALDAAGTPISGVHFQFLSGEPSVAVVAADGTLTGAGEGFATIIARIPAASSDPALVATLWVHVMPKPAYQLKKLLSTDVTGTTTIAAFNTVSAVSQSEIGAIATLANGGQAALLIENGKLTTLAAVGQVLPNAARMVVRIDGISANAHGDVALLIEYPSQFCNASVILFPHGQAEEEIGAANCNNGLYPRSLAADGTVLYRFNDQILSSSPTGPPRLLFSIATQLSAKDPVKTVNDFSPSRAGTFVLNANLASGIHAYFYFDGKNLNQVLKDGDAVGSVVPNSIDMPVGGDDGTFYVRVNGPNLEMLAQFAPGTPKPLITTRDPVAGGTLGWLGTIVDVGPGGVLVEADLNTKVYHSAVAVWDGKALNEYATLLGYGGLLSGAVIPNGTALVSAVLTGETSITPLRAFSGSAPASLLIPVKTALPQPVPAAVDWHYSSRGGSSSGMVFRGAGDAIVTVGSNPQTLALLGSPLPNGQIAMWIGAAMADQAGDLVFSAGYPTGSALFRYRGGKLDTLIDSAVAGTGPASRSLNYANSYRGRYLAMNNHGDVAAASSYNSGTQYDIVTFDSFGPHFVAQLNTTAPGGGNYTNFQTITMDDNGHVAFVAQTSDGHTAAYYWDGNNIQRLIGTGDAGASGLTVNEVSNIAGGGSGFLIVLAFGNYQLRELRSFDGAQMRTLQSSNGALLDGAGLSYYWANEVTFSANGDAHTMAATQDNGTGIYAHRGDGRDLVVARARDLLPAGERLIMPLSVASSSTGAVFFTADVLVNGVEMLALYQGTAQ